MNIVFVLSIIYLIILFLLYKKNDKKMCLLSSIIYSVGLLFCYNTTIVFLMYLLGIKGSLLLYSIINLLIGSSLLIVTLKKRMGIQKYYLDKRKLALMLSLIVIIFLVGAFRFRGFDVISFESGDSAVHYRHALEFSEELSMLDKVNSKDDVYNNFFRVMPISYINCGFIFNIFSGAKTYITFLYYNVFCLIMASLIFFVTVINIFKFDKKSSFFAMFLSLLYTLSFPFNNMIMGFCYLSLSIIVINLLYLTILYLKDNFKKDIIIKAVVILFMTFSCFCSYYLFVPVIYLSLGLYYIFLWKKKKLVFKEMCLYIIVTLIIPFIIGFSYFLITLYFDDGVGSIGKLINMWGYSYNNITPTYIFMALTVYFVYEFMKKNKGKSIVKEFMNIDYLKLNVYVLTLYVCFFLLLFILRLSDLYYYYKLYSFYSLLLVLYFVPKLLKHKNICYIFALVVFCFNIFAYNNTNNKISLAVARTNIFTWNTYTLIDNRITLDEDEMKMMEESQKYYDECVQDGKFLMLGSAEKTIWLYSITDVIPFWGSEKDNLKNLYKQTIPSFYIWDEAMFDYRCLIYYYEGNEVKVDNNKYKILYENSAGAIVKRLENKY